MIERNHPNVSPKAGQLSYSVTAGERLVSKAAAAEVENVAQTSQDEANAPEL